MISQNQNPNPLISTMGEHGLPGVLVAAHRRAQQQAPANARSYTVAYSFVDSQGNSVEGPTPSVRTIVRYYEDNSGRNKIERKRFGSSLLANAVMVVAMTLLVVIPITAQQRRDPTAVLDTVTYRVDRTIYSVDRITGTINRLRKRKQPKPPVTNQSVQCRATGNGTTRPRRACR